MSEQDRRECRGKRRQEPGQWYFSAVGQADNTGCCLLHIRLICAGM